MRRSRFSEEQIAYALWQAEHGTTVAEKCRKMGVSPQTFFLWKKRFAGMGVSEVRRMKQLEDILRLDRPVRCRLTKLLRKTKDHQIALRILMILKLDQGLSTQRLARDLQCAAATVVGAAKRYRELGED